MSKIKLSLTATAAVLLAGCGTASPAGSTQTTADAAQPSSEAASFASYIKGEWTCDRDSPDHHDVDLELPVFGVGSLEKSEITVDDGTWSASWGSQVDDKAEGTWKINGREISITSPLGTQVVGNLPETPEQAMEPMKLKIENSRNDVTLQVQGERTLTIKSSGGYVSDCMKY